MFELPLSNYTNHLSLTVHNHKTPRKMIEKCRPCNYRLDRERINQLDIRKINLKFKP